MDARQRESPPIFRSARTFVREGDRRWQDAKPASADDGTGRNLTNEEPSASLALDDPQPTGNRR
jgi:hypothetical protein